MQTGKIKRPGLFSKADVGHRWSVSRTNSLDKEPVNRQDPKTVQNKSK